MWRISGLLDKKSFYVGRSFWSQIVFFRSQHQTKNYRHLAKASKDAVYKSINNTSLPAISC